MIRKRTIRKRIELVSPRPCRRGGAALLAAAIACLFAPQVRGGQKGFVVRYGYSKSGSAGKLGAAIRESRIFEEAGKALESLARVPERVTIRVLDSHESGPHHDPGNKTMVFPIEFLEELKHLLVRENRKASAEEIEGWLLDLAQFVIIHERAHALIDVLDLPIVGKGTRRECGSIMGCGGPPGRRSGSMDRERS